VDDDRGQNLFFGGGAVIIFLNEKRWEDVREELEIYGVSQTFWYR
jgi:hypothetical protein